MTDRLPIAKTHKQYVGGAFIRSESGRDLTVPTGSVPLSTRKDLRNAVEAAKAGRSKWSKATAYLRGQILYRMGEMLEGKRAEFAAVTPGGEREVDASVDRLVAFAGWSDKFQQILGVANPVAGPYHNFTVPEACGVVGVIAPDDPPLLGLVSLIAPVICSGNTVVAIGSETSPVSACLLGEVCATSDVPAGVVNILTGKRSELIEHFSSHREFAAIHASVTDANHRGTLRRGAAENLKRVRLAECEGDEWFASEPESPWWIEPFVEPKTIWHPSAV